MFKLHCTQDHLLYTIYYIVCIVLYCIIKNSIMFTLKLYK